MTRPSIRRASAALVGTVFSIAAFACSSGFHVTPDPDAGSPDADSADANASDARLVDANRGDAKVMSEASTPTNPPTLTLFARLGGEPGLAQLVDAIMAAELADPEIAAYFAANALSPPPNGRPTIDQIKECLVKQLAAAAGGPGNFYPTTVSGGYACRDMKMVHSNSQVTTQAFDKFAAIANNICTSSGKIAVADCQALAAFFQIQKADVVD